MIQALINTGKPAFVFVSSSTSPKDKNPLTSTEKVEFLRKIFPRGVTFVDTAACEPKCGGPIAAREYLVAKGYTNLTLVGGSDREAEFGPDSRIWDYLKKPDYDGPIKTPPTFLALARNATDTSGSTATTTMSGTKARGFVAAGDFESFKKAVTLGNVTDADAQRLYNLLQARLSKKKGGNATGEEDVSLFDADQEPQGGRRKTRRNKRTRRLRHRS